MTALQTDDPHTRAIAASDVLRLAPVLGLHAGGSQDAASGERRFTPAELRHEGRIGLLFEEMRAVHGPQHRQAAAQDLLRDLTRDTMYFVGASLYLTRSAPDLGPDNLLFCWRDSRFAMPELLTARTAVVSSAGITPDDRTVVLPDVDALDRWLAARFTATFAPLLSEIRAHTRVGLRLLWGYVSDMLHFRMLQVARDLGEDRNAAWQRADRLVAALCEAGAPIRTGPRPFRLREDDPDALWAVRGVCCFDFRADPDHGFCSTCPLECDDVRRPPLAAKFAPDAERAR